MFRFNIKNSKKLTFKIIRELLYKYICANIRREMKNINHKVFQYNFLTSFRTKKRIEKNKKYIKINL